ncbi:MAG: hypothetical protein DRI87_10305 [Bacteroidetes bacterium]|nr:MAG: hypothetical protein DRI87_10305 [Bacteroidota bacterium]
MKNLLIILTALLLTFSLLISTGCKKEDARPSYELRFTSTSDNPYLIEIDGTSEVIPGHTFKNYILEQGTYPWKVTQQSGYVLYPTVREGTITLDQDKEIIFP